MNAVGIDVSKGKSMIAIMRPFAELGDKPFGIAHLASVLGKMAALLISLYCEICFVMEYTGRYYQPAFRTWNIK